MIHKLLLIVCGYGEMKQYNVLKQYGVTNIRKFITKVGLSPLPPKNFMLMVLSSVQGNSGSGSNIIKSIRAYNESPVPSLFPF